MSLNREHREVHAVILKQRTAVPSVSPEVARAADRKSGLMRLLLVSIGALLLTLAAGSALADALRADGTEALHGTEGDDLLTGSGRDDGIWGLGGDDELYGGGGPELILGGAGDDFIEAKDGKADFVGCGPGKDVASVDLLDRIEGDCETLYPG
jgi:Ca2+-binding RTX toxin-like protein